MIIKKKGKPITGSAAQMTPKKPVTTDTSRNTEKQIKMPQQPFASKQGAALAPISQQRLEADNADYATAIRKKNIGHMALPNQKHVGQNKKINHSKNIFGRFGTNHPKRSSSQGAQPKSKKSAFFGE